MPKHFNELCHTQDILNHDIICLSETWLNSSHPSSHYQIPNYTLLRKDRGMSSRGGGLAIYIKNSIAFNFAHISLPKTECLSVEINSKQSKICIILVYNPPSSNTLIADDLERLFESRKFHEPTIVLGDFNIDWLKKSPLKKNVETLMSLNGLRQLVNEPTRVTTTTKTLIDLVFSNSENFIDQLQILKTDISDHFAVRFNLKYETKQSFGYYKTQRDFKKFDEVEFFDHAKYINFDHTENINCPHKAAEFLESKIELLVDQFAPFKTRKVISSTPKFWKCAHTTKLSKLKKNAFDDFVKTNFDKSSPEWETYRKLRNKVANEISLAKKKANSRILNDDTISHWDKIRIFRGENQASYNRITELEFQGTLLQNDHEIAHGLNSYFSTIGTNLNNDAKAKAGTLPSSSNIESNILPQFKFALSEVSNAEVSETLYSLKSRKCGGVNQIPAFVYKILEPLILNPLTHVINTSIKNSQFPDIWKKALVIALHKGGKHDQPSNYRPISLLPILSKVFEKILNKQIRDYFENHLLIGDRQFGFRSGMSTDQLILQLVNKIRNLNKHEESKYVTLAALDIKKAFDCVNHELLIDKLIKKFNFQSTSSKLIADYLTNRSQCMRANNQISSKQMVPTGVPQGSVLGPLLFISFINDLMNIKDCYLFADDCLLLTSGATQYQAKLDMERKISLASDWYTKNQLILNATKTDVMTITNHKSDSPPDLHLHNHVIKQSKKIKYLGVILDHRLNMNAHVKKIKQKLYPVINCFSRQRRFLNLGLAAKWYTGLIRPVIEYCAPVLYGSNNEVRENLLKIENRCLKIINIHKSKDFTRRQLQIHNLVTRLHYLYMLSYFKTTNSLVPIIDKNLLPEKLNSITRLGTSSGFRLSKDRAKFSLCNFGAKAFNDLPEHIRTCKNLKAFKSAVKPHFFKPIV